MPLEGPWIEAYMAYYSSMSTVQLQLDNEDQNKDLDIVFHRGMLEPGAYGSLITSACYSGQR